MKKGETLLVAVLDRSGSMETTKDDAIGGFAACIEAQKTVPGTCLVTLVRFDDRFEWVYERRPLAQVPPLVLHPRGQTALTDAVGKTIDKVGSDLAALSEDERPEHVVLAIITDGQENASVRYTTAQVRDMIALQRDAYHWTFLFIGADPSTWSMAHRYGITRDTTVMYNATAGARGTQEVYGTVMNNVLTRVRTGQDASVTDEERRLATT